MHFSKKIHFYFLILLIFSTVMAIAGIRGFLRLAPAIDEINLHNTRSLYYAEQMLSELVVNRNMKNFENAMHLEKANITEVGEADLIKKIEKNYKSAFSGNIKKEEEIVDYIIDLSTINRNAMKRATIEANQLSSVGAWVIVFLTIFIWFLGFMLMKSIEKGFIKPLDELNDVLAKYNQGNKLRRCPKQAPNKDLQKIEFKTGNGVNVIKNLDGSVYKANNDFAEILSKHIISPVRFDKALNIFKKEKIERFIEIGPGKSMSGFINKEKLEGLILNVQKVEDLEKLK